MLAAAVDAGEGLLVEENLQTQLRGFPVHDLHEAHVAVAGHVGSTEDGGHLVLARCHLVVLHRHGAADLQHFRLEECSESKSYSNFTPELIALHRAVLDPLGLAQLADDFIDP